MATALTKSLPINGCAVYLMKDGKQVGLGPVLDSVTISLPSIEFETTTIPMMGSYDVPDPSRIPNLQVTITIPCDNLAARTLAQPGVCEWKITWVSQEYSAATGMNVPTGWVVLCRGHVVNIPNAEVSVGGENTSDITMNVIAISKRSNTSPSVESYALDRSAGSLRVNGVEYAKGINSLF